MQDAVRRASPGDTTVVRGVHTATVSACRSGAPGPAGAFPATGNLILDDFRACPASEEAPPISCTGVTLLGARLVQVTENSIDGDVPPGRPHFGAGWSRRAGSAAPSRTDSPVFGNSFGRNRPDIF